MSALDYIAIAWFFALIALFEAALYLPPLARRTLTHSVQQQRRLWITNTSMREQRQFDAILIASLTQSIAFFASTSVIGIGGLVAIMGSGDKAKVLLEQLPFVRVAEPAVWEMKILFMMGILVYAFFKFAWAFRLSHYNVMVFGAMPAADDPDAARRQSYSEELARLLGLVGDHANAGLRSFYYAFAAIAWFFHPALFMLAMALVVAVLLRREFVSRASGILEKIRPKT